MQADAMVDRWSTGSVRINLGDVNGETARRREEVIRLGETGDSQTA